IVATGEMDAAIERVVKGLTTSGVVSAAGNRRAIRIAQEPLDMFRAYFAVYAREQAYCHFSPALIANLERYWNAQSPQPSRCDARSLPFVPAKAGDPALCAGFPLSRE